jgi:hypothetical protein
VHFGEAYEKIQCRLFRLVEFAIVNHIDDGIGCVGEFIGVIVTAKIAMRMIVVVVVMMVGGGGESRGGGLKEDSALGTLILLEAAALVFLSAAAVAWIVASNLDLVHLGDDFTKLERRRGADDAGDPGGYPILRVAAGF